MRLDKNVGVLRPLLRGLAVFVIAITGFSARIPAAQAVQDKIDPWLLSQQFTLSAAGGEVEFIVSLSDQADLRGASALPTRQEKGRYVFDRLTSLAERTQAPLIAHLQELGAEIRPFWITNMVWAKGNWNAVTAVAARYDVSYVYGNPAVTADLPQPDGSEISPLVVDGVEWNIKKIKANQVWNAGFNGEGAVIGGQDTGYQWDHPALKDSYRGWNGSAADHSYSWHDAIHAVNDDCPADSPVPCDDHGHGTHTMGTMVGKDGKANQIGVAPGAKWIGCRNMNKGIGTPATYTECFQWFLAPYPQGSDPASGNPEMAPDVINNSWGCPPSEGCSIAQIDLLRQVVENLRSAGILVVSSAGNSGPSCSTVSDPAAIYDSVFSVGSTDSEDNISGFSSRGPVTVDGSERMKPDVSAPGEAVRSSYLDNSYASLSGTSMASPHVAALAALLISTDPSLRGNPDAIETLISTSAVPRESGETCGGISESQIPNNTFGWGRIDAFAAYQMIGDIKAIYLPTIAR